MRKVTGKKKKKRNRKTKDVLLRLLRKEKAKNQTGKPKYAAFKHTWSSSKKTVIGGRKGMKKSPRSTNLQVGEQENRGGRL